MNEDWVASLKVGDSVGVVSYYGNKSCGVVKRITDYGQVRLQDGKLFKLNGFERTTDSHVSRIVPYTTEFADIEERSRLIRDIICNVKYEWLLMVSIEQLRVIDAAFRRRYPIETDLWSVYQRTGDYGDMTRWLKHAAYERFVSGEKTQ